MDTLVPNTSATAIAIKTSTNQVKIIGNEYQQLSTNHTINHPNKSSIYSSFRDSSSNVRLIWSLVIMSLIIYTPMEIAWNSAFSIDLSASHSCFITAIIIDILLCIDIIINFITPYYDKHCIEHTKYSEIARNYCFGTYCNRYGCSIRCGGWFWVDLLTSIPFEAFYTVSFVFAVFKTILLLLRFIKLLRLVKLVDQIKLAIQQKFGLTYVLLFRVFRIITLMLMVAHLMSCLWIYLGFLNFNKANGSWLSEICDIECDIDNISNCRIYLYALHWSLVNLFTTGHSISITATNELEEVITTFCVLLSTFFFAFLIGTVTNIINEGDPRKSIKNQKLEQAQAFCEHHELSNELSTKLLKRIQYYCDKNYMFDENEIFNILPQYLQSAISKEVAPLLVNDQIAYEKIEFFGFLPESEQNKIVGLIALSMKVIQCDANYYLYEKNDIAKDFYIFISGHASLKATRTSSGRKLERGDVCGEYAIINSKRNSYVKCKVLSEFYVIKIKDIQMILEQNYGNKWEKKWKQVQQYLIINYGKSRICALQSQDSSLKIKEVDTNFCCGPDRILTPESSLGSDIDSFGDKIIQFQPTVRKEENKLFSKPSSIQLSIIPPVETDECKYNDDFHSQTDAEITDAHAIFEPSAIEEPSILSLQQTDYDPILNESY